MKVDFIEAPRNAGGADDPAILVFAEKQGKRTTRYRCRCSCQWEQLLPTRRELERYVAAHVEAFHEDAVALVVER